MSDGSEGERRYGYGAASNDDFEAIAQAERLADGSVHFEVVLLENEPNRPTAPTYRASEEYVEDEG